MVHSQLRSHKFGLYWPPFVRFMCPMPSVQVSQKDFNPIPFLSKLVSHCLFFTLCPPLGSLCQSWSLFHRKKNLHCWNLNLLLNSMFKSALLLFRFHKSFYNWWEKETKENKFVMLHISWCSVVTLGPIQIPKHHLGLQ